MANAERALEFMDKIEAETGKQISDGLFDALVYMLDNSPAGGSLSGFKRRFDIRMNDFLCEMKPGYDDSIVGFNDAWKVANALLSETLAASPAAPVPAEGEGEMDLVEGVAALRAITKAHGLSLDAPARDDGEGWRCALNFYGRPDVSVLSCQKLVDEALAAAYERGRKDERYEIAATLSAAKFFELATIVRARTTDHAKEATDE